MIDPNHRQPEIAEPDACVASPDLLAARLRSARAGIAAALAIAKGEEIPRAVADDLDIATDCLNAMIDDRTAAEELARRPGPRYGLRMWLAIELSLLDFDAREAVAPKVKSLVGFLETAIKRALDAILEAVVTNQEFLVRWPRGPCVISAGGKTARFAPLS